MFNKKKEKFSVLRNNSDIYDDIASRMISKLRENNSKGKETVFILPVGPRGQYPRFVQMCNQENISCKNLITINMDEFLDKDNCYFPMPSPFSFRGFMKKNFFDFLEKSSKMNPENILFPDPKNTGKLHELLLKVDGADICFAGVGINGHIAFNEPEDQKTTTLEEFKKLSTRIASLDSKTIIMTSLKHGGYIEKIPTRCVTIGMQEILLSREIRVYLEHAHQAAIFEKILYCNPSPEIPVTILKEHPNYSLTISEEVLDSYRYNSSISG